MPVCESYSNVWKPFASKRYVSKIPSKSPQNSPMSQKIISPILDSLDRKLPNFSDEMRKTVTNKTWYFVPVRLNKLPVKITGIQFDSDQTIIQLEKSVWVDKIKFAALKENEQGTLILHELVMGAVMKHRNNQITENDSDLVRTTTIYLQSHQNDSAEVLRAKLGEIEYFYPTAYDWLVHGNDPMGQLYKLMQGLKSDHELPNEHECYGGMSEALETICVSQVKNDSVKGTLTVSSFYRVLGQDARTISEGTPVEVTVSGRPRVSLFNSSFGVGSMPNISYTYVEGEDSAHDGEIRRALSVVKNGVGNDVDGLHITYQICHDSSNSGKCIWVAPTVKELKAQSLSLEDQRTCASTSWSKTNID